MVKRVSDAGEGRETVAGILMDLKATPDGFIATLVDEEGELFVRIASKLAKGLKLDKAMIVAGYLKENKSSGKRWMVAEKVHCGSDVSDEEVKSWHDLEDRTEQRKMDIDELRNSPRRSKAKSKTFAEKSDEVFLSLKDKLGLDKDNA